MVFDLDSILRLVSAIGAIAAAVAATVNALRSQGSRQKLEAVERAVVEVHLSINSRMDQLLEEGGMTSRALGVEEERARARTPESR